MSKTIHLGPGLNLPASDAVTQKFAFMGQSGSGKSYAAGKFVEELIGIDAQVVVLDPIGNWWGLRLGADGKSKGLPVYVFGGRRGDIPLEATGGVLAADIVVDHGAPMVLDVSEFTNRELYQFVTAFATQLLRRKKGSPSPLMLVWEECQDMIPQRVMAEQARMVGAVEKLAKQGRNYGIGSTFISQRPQAVNKDVLNQAGTLLAFRTIGKQERHALRDWMTEKAVDANIAEELPSLETGMCYAWSPGWLKTFGMVKIAKKATFDAGETPTGNWKAHAEKPLAPVDLAKISQAMAATIERAKENDPASLKKRIAELERELASKKPVLDLETINRAVAMALRTTKISALSIIRGEFEKYLNSVQSQIGALYDEDAPLAVPQGSPTPSAAEIKRHVAVASATVVEVERQATNGRRMKSEASDVHSVNAGDDLRKGAREMLQALASLHPRSLSRAQVATLAGLSPSSGTFSAYLSDLRKGAFIAELSGLALVITQKGMAAAERWGAQQIRPTTENLVALWSRKLRKGARGMLEELVSLYPRSRTREELADSVGIVATSGTFSAYLSDLHKNGLVEKIGNGEISASASLFP